MNKIFYIPFPCICTKILERFSDMCNKICEIAVLSVFLSFFQASCLLKAECLTSHGLRTNFNT
jgi:hypothetical protein